MKKSSGKGPIVKSPFVDAVLKGPKGSPKKPK